ncbi:hypothetical protein [Ornithinimicrobium sediminis]|uniref:hypothetical protein n=1 Tax=Ornithinimicrobium sediminis TaxID=2904603 RepID=UPI001E46B8F4|nr:hypothetical protein [Ornithinimicrobium sediminis]
MAAGAAAVALAATPAMAGNPHFIASQTRVSLVGMDLSVKFKEAGLESGSQVTVELSAHLEATYQCINKGGNNPADPKKTTVDTDVAANAPFTVPKNGNLVGTINLPAPAAADVLDCPGGQTSTLTEVTWSMLELNDLTTGAYLALPGTYSAGATVGKGK